MKLLFLDIDGVLNSHVFYQSLDGNKDSLDPEAIARLNKITDITGAKIVISSSWRYSFEKIPNMLFQLLKDEGVTGEIIGMTPITTWYRWEEIEDWLAKHTIAEEFIILDDIGFMGALQDHLIHTTYSYGLLDEHVELAIKKLML